MWFSSGIYMSNKDVYSHKYGIQCYYITYGMSDKELKWLAFNVFQPLLRLQLICLWYQLCCGRNLFTEWISVMKGVFGSFGVFFTASLLVPELCFLLSWAAHPIWCNPFLQVKNFQGDPCVRYWLTNGMSCSTTVEFSSCILGGP